MNINYTQNIDIQAFKHVIFVMSNIYILSHKRSIRANSDPFRAIISKLSIGFALTLLASSALFGQINDEEFRLINESINILLEEFIENSDGDADFDFNTITEELYHIYIDKIDINKAGTQDLDGLLFLNANDIQNILSYRENFGELLSPYEIQAIPNLSAEKARLLLSFVKVTGDRLPALPFQIKELNQSKDEVYLKWRKTLEMRKGHVVLTDGSTKYAGDPNYLYLRYAHSDYKDQKWGLIIEKDAGEQFVNSNSVTGLDYLSAHYQEKNISPLIRQLNLGDYSVSMGQGLVTHSSFGVGKSSLSTNVAKGAASIRNFSSVLENQAMRGISTVLQPSDNIRMLAFLSYDRRDANITQDDQTEIPQFISSIQSSGLHRTTNEIEDQDGVGELTYGAHLDWSNRNLTIGVNTIHHHFDKKIQRQFAPYRIFQWEGERLSNYSIDYKWLYNGWNLFGEFAHSSNGGWAGIQGAIKSLDRTFDLAAIYRNYGRRYQALFPNAFGESQSANNEEGIYIGMHIHTSNKVTLKAYVDFWNNDWLRSRVDGTGKGNEYLFRAEYKPNRQQLFYLLYRYERKSENTNLQSDFDFPVLKTTQRLRLHIQHNMGNGISLRTRGEIAHYKKEINTSTGYLLYQDIIYSPMSSPLSMASRLGYFNTEDSNSRIYAYENDLLYEYYIPAYSGHGLRYYIKARYKINGNLMFEARLDQTRYFDREVISSGNQEVLSNAITGIKCQLRVRF
ncbi:MAG: hypothetical protein ACI9FN_002168 [Saprospiraceae bacterium]|jgi:hypothetical protein